MDFHSMVVEFSEFTKRTIQFFIKKISIKNKDKAATVFLGKVYTVDNENEWAEGVAVSKDGTIVCVGTKEVKIILQYICMYN